MPLKLLPDLAVEADTSVPGFDSAKTPVNSFVTSRVDYCNSLLASAPVYRTDQLQRVLNAAARLLLRVPRFDLDLRVKIKDFIGCVFRNA